MNEKDVQLWLKQEPLAQALFRVEDNEKISLLVECELRPWDEVYVIVFWQISYLKLDFIEGIGGLSQKEYFRAYVVPEPCGFFDFIGELAKTDKLLGVKVQEEL